MSRTHLALGSIGLLVLGSASLGLGCKKSARAPWKLPLDAKQLPSTTNLLIAETIDGTRETDPHARQMYTAAELGTEICRTHESNPALDLEMMSVLGAYGAKRFFSAQHLADVQSLLECGGHLGASLQGAFQTEIEFTDDSGGKQDVGIVTVKTSDLPATTGYSKHAFSGMDGFCLTADQSRPNAPPKDCGPTTQAALAQGSTWFFGSRTALETVAHAVTAPKKDLSTGVSALNDAANEIEGLSSMRISSGLTSAKPFLSAPCSWGGFQTAGSLDNFVQGCFPKTDDKIIQDIDARLRAAAFEIEPDVLKAGSVHGNVVLVARDDDAAKAVEKDAQDLATDWKSTVENNEGNLVKQAKTNPKSLRQKSWAIIVDNFTRALKNLKVSRSGRTVKLAFNEPLDAGDRRDLADANKETLDKRVAVADVLDAIQQKKALPTDALAKLVGAPWAAYLAQSAAYDPKNLPADCKEARPVKAAKGKKVAAPAANPACRPPVEPPESQFGDHPAAEAKK